MGFWIATSTAGRVRSYVALAALITALTVLVPAPAAAADGNRYSPIADEIWMTNGVGVVRSMHAVGNVMYVGGDFTAVRDSYDGSDVSPGRLAAFNVATGARISGFQPTFNGQVRDIASSADGSVLYVVGTFTLVNGASQRRLVALDAADGSTISSFNVDLTGSANAVAVASDGDVIVGGSFLTANGTTRNRLARFAPNGNLRSWAPSVDDETVLDIWEDDTTGRIYVGGRFTGIGGAADTAYFVAFDQNTGVLDGGFDVQPGRPVLEIAIKGNTLALAMAGFGGRGALYDADDGDFRAQWNADGDVQSVEIIDDIAYFGGHWEDQFGGETSKRILGVDIDDNSLLTSFKPVTSGAPGVWDITEAGQFLWVGGGLVDAQPTRVRGFARYSPIGGPDDDGPTQPTNPVATALTDDSILLTWGQSFDPAVPITYRIEEGGSPIGTTQDTSYTVTGLAPSTQHNYRIIAVDFYGNDSIPSALAQATTFPAPDDVLIAQESSWRYHDEGADLGTSWRTPGYNHSSWDQGPGAFGFNVDDLGTVIDGGPAGNRHITTYFRKTFDFAGVGTDYVELDLRRDDGVVIYINGTEVLRNNMPGGTITASTRASTGIDGEDEDIYVSHPIDGAALQPGTNLIAVEVHQVSSGSSDLAFDLGLNAAVVPDTVNPSTPTGLNSPALNGDHVELAWTASTDNVQVASYDVFRDGGKIATVSSTSYDDTTVDENVTYSYQVRATDLAGNRSAKSSPLVVLADGSPPTKPTGLSKTAKTSSSISLTWNASSDNVGVVKYKIIRDGSKVGTTNQLSFTDTGLDADTLYKYRVRAVDAAGNQSAKSAVLGVTTKPDTEPPTKPKNLKVTNATSSTISLQWKRSSDNHGVDHYRVFVDGVVVGSTSGRTFTVTGLDPETSYDFKVRPVDTSNNFGPRSKVVTASTTGENLLVVRKGSTWRYKDDDFDLGEAWHQPNFDETNWKSGDGEFGFGDGDEQTVVNGGPSNDRTITFYFRIEFDVPDADQFSAIKLQLLRDDGAILFLNGTEILRDNLPGGNIGHNTTALSSVSGADESTYFVFTVDSGALIDGANALAVEIHQASSTSSDLSFDLKVTLLG